jgi:hypothetical protein
MKKIIKIIRLTMAIFILFTNNIYGIQPGRFDFFSGKVFVISIGVDKYTNFSDLRFCQSDADYFLKSLQKDTSIKEIIKLAFRNYGTKEELTLAFNEVIQNANVNDLFIFYYAGIYNGKSLQLTNEELKYEDVITLSQNIHAKRQVYILDTMDGEQYEIAFKQFSKQKPFEKKSNEINKIFISNKGISYDSAEVTNLKDPTFNGSPLTGGISNSKFLLTEMFRDSNKSDKFWTKFKDDIYKTYNYKLLDLVVFSNQNY